jgi:predicted phage-related endonuclease
MTGAVGELVTPTGRLVLPPGADRAQWLEYRKWREDVPGGWCIGASEIPSILDLDGVDTPAHVYREKYGLARKRQTDQMRWGQIFEKPIADEWCLRNRAVIDEIGLVSHVDMPWLGTTIDRRVRECPTFPEIRDNCGLEVKHVDYVSPSRWRSGIPDRVMAQVIGELIVTGFDHVHIAAKIPGTMAQAIVWREREQELIDYVLAEVTAFRDTYLIPGVEPAWDTSRKAAKLIELDELSHPERTGEIGIDQLDDVFAYAEAAAAESAARTRKQQALAALRQHADGHEVVTFSGDLAYRFGAQTRRTVRLERLAEKYPDAYADPEVISETVSHPIYLGREYKIRNGDG